MLETSGSVQACNWIAVTFTFFSRYYSFTTTQSKTIKLQSHLNVSISLDALILTEKTKNVAVLLTVAGRCVCASSGTNAIMHMHHVPFLKLECYLGIVSSQLCVWNLGNGGQSNTTVSHKFVWKLHNEQLHALGSRDRASWAKYEESKNKIFNNYIFIITFCLNIYPPSLCPSSGDEKVCYCIWCIFVFFCIWLVAVVRPHSANNLQDGAALPLQTTSKKTNIYTP